MTTESPKSPIDKRKKLTEEVFAYKATKEQKVFISWHGKPVTILGGDKARRFLADIAGAGHQQAQLIMAKATGHFKHGNEKMSKRK